MGRIHTTRSALLAGPAALLAALLTAAAGAAPIAVPNASFEDPDVNDGQMFGALGPGDVTGWGPAFAGVGVSGGGVHDPQDSHYAGSTGDGTALPGDADQGQALFLQGTVAGNSESFVTLSDLATIAEDTTYTLTVAVGNPLDAEPGEVRLQILAAGGPVATTFLDPGTLPDGTFTDVDTQLVTGVGDPLAGLPLRVRVFQLVSENELQIVHFDDVRLTTDAVVVPEPAGAWLLLAGGAALLGAGRVRRRRRGPNG